MGEADILLGIDYEVKWLATRRLVLGLHDEDSYR